MTSITYSSVRIQTSAQSVPAIPSWFGEVTLIVHYLRRQDVLSQIEKQVHFARRRFGHYDVIDFVAVPPSLCHQRGTHPGSLLPTRLAFCLDLHGALRARSLARALDGETAFWPL